jgi:hypothetical protein
MTFCDDANEKSFCSDKSQEKLNEKKKEVYNLNGWNLKMGSLLNEDNLGFSKSYIKKDNAGIKPK